MILWFYIFMAYLITAKIQWICRAHEIHENLNPTEITNHYGIIHTKSHDHLSYTPDHIITYHTHQIT